MRALLVIDMLKDFVYEEGALPVHSARKIIEPINRKIAEFRSRGEPVFFICDAHSKEDEEFEVWGEHAVDGTWGAEIIDELDKREEDVVIKKKRFSAFYGTNLEEELRKRGIEEVVLTGVLTNICVLHTAADAAMRGFRVVVPRDCVAAIDEQAERWALMHMAEVLGAEVV
jgi:nicotinamidase-related amidase